MDDEEETYRLWKIRKTIMQVSRGKGCASKRKTGQAGRRSGRVIGHLRPAVRLVSKSGEGGRRFGGPGQRGVEVVSWGLGLVDGSETRPRLRAGRPEPWLRKWGLSPGAVAHI